MKYGVIRKWLASKKKGLIKLWPLNQIIFYFWVGSHRSISKNSKGCTDFYYSKYILHSISKAILDRLIKYSIMIIIIIWWSKWQMKEGLQQIESRRWATADGKSPPPPAQWCPPSICQMNRWQDWSELIIQDSQMDVVLCAM